MITEIEIGQIPCFQGTDASTLPLQQLTFIYGPNGSGKSSIAKKIQETARDNANLACELYNKDFTERLLKADTQIPGVLVIRDADEADQERLEALTNPSTGEIPKKQNLKLRFEGTKANSEQVLASAKSKLSQECWDHRKSLPAEMQPAFRGYLNSADKFVEELLRRRQAATDSSPRGKDEILSAYKTLDVPEQDTQETLPSFPSLTEPSDETINNLSTPLKSKEETSFGEFVEILQNSDWVRHGRDFLDHSNGRCPFCQQKLPLGISADLDALFDQHYESSLKSLRDYVNIEDQNAEEVEQFIESLEGISGVDVQELKDLTKTLLKDAEFRRNTIRIKIASPSESVSLPPYQYSAEHINSLIRAANLDINENNRLLADRDAARSALNNEVWEYFIRDVAHSSFSVYDGAIEAPTATLGGVTPKIDRTVSDLETLTHELLDIQSRTSSSLPTVEAINETLNGLGFRSFKLEKLPQDDTYRIIRLNGSSAVESLSEGERTLVSYLYFYHRLKQSYSDAGSSSHVVAVFDDPVSSLDGETLFVINTLLRRILVDCASDSNNLKQVILLTHNAYFLKEANFTPNGMKSGARKFFTIRKTQNGSSVPVEHDEMPIKSNYSQLWDQVKAAQDSDNAQFSASLPNSMRRIIENYFHITGGITPSEIIEKIPENNRWTCQALLSWYNDGSHTAPWDVDYSSISPDISAHLDAFKEIFAASGHMAHYEMMMQSARS